MGLLRSSLRLIIVIAASLNVATAQAEDFPLVVQTDPLTPEEQQKKFHLPPGFEIQLVAAEPDVQKPINLNFDHARRLFFSQSVEYPFAAKSDKKPRDTVRVIEGIGEDGRAAKVRTAVDGLNIPIGVLPLHDRLLVFSIPNIYSCRDEDGDGLYEKREVLFGPFGERDTHGLNNGFTRGLDGWIYACHGFANDSRVKGRDGNEIVMNSGNTYRFRADGSRIEHYTHGQVNPFGLCFDPLGNLYSADCHTLPAYMLLRGAYYPSFGKPHDGLGFGPAIMSHSHDSTGIAGIVYYAAEHFPAEYRDTLFIGNPITHRVNHDKLQWHGSTPTAIEQPDFIKCDDPWFRPVDLKLGPDGALYIADFYNRIIGHYEVDLHHPGRDRERGRIWRVVYKGTHEKPVESPKLPDLTKLDLDGLIAKLGDSNFVVRTMATHEMIDRSAQQGASRLRALLANGELSNSQKAHAAWIFCATGPIRERPAEIFRETQLMNLIRDKSVLVRANASRAINALGPPTDTGPDSAPIFGAVAIKDDSPIVRRLALEGLAPHHLVLVPLLWFLDETDSEDSQLVHATRIAIRNCLLKPDAYSVLKQALSKQVGNQSRLHGLAADVSLGVPTRDSAEYVLGHVQEHSMKTQRFGEMLAHVVRHLPAERLPEALKLLEKLREEPVMRQRATLATVHQALEARGHKIPEELIAWAGAVAAKLLSSGRERQIVQGASLAREMKLSAVRPQLEAIATATEFPAVRPIAIDAYVACDAAGSLPLLARIAGSAKEPMAIRQKAAQALSTVNSAAAHRELLGLLAIAPVQLESDLAAGLASNPQAAEMLVAAIESGKAPAQVLRNPQVAQRLRRLSHKSLEVRIEKIAATLPNIDERVQNLITSRIAGFAQSKADAAAGKLVYTKTCAACHKIGGEGTKIGPDLDGIGNRGLERLVEDILDPSRNVDQAFRTTLITTGNGQALNGLALREEGQVLVLADNQGKEVRVQLDNIDERTVSPLSPMPANVAEQLAEPEFYHLLAFLLRQHRTDK